MGKFIALVDSALSVKLKINDDLLESFMKKVTDWEYYVTKKRCLALYQEEKENHMKQYYTEMVKK